MDRLACIVVPDVPHHVTGRGARREPIYFQHDDQEFYADILAEPLRRATVSCWAYCLMPNHVHLILNPRRDGLGRAMGAAQRRWANHVNARGRWRGRLFDGRFASVAMDEEHLLAAIRYVSVDPVGAGLAARAEDWPWSSVGAHLKGRDDGLVQVRPALERLAPITFATFLDQDEPPGASQRLRAAETTGRAVGPAAFVSDLERRLGRPVVRPQAETGGRGAG